MAKKNVVRVLITIFFALINSSFLYCSAGEGNFVLASGKRVSTHWKIIGAPIPQQPQSAIALGSNETLKKSNKSDTLLRVNLLRSFSERRISDCRKIECELTQTQQLLQKSLRDEKLLRDQIKELQKQKSELEAYKRKIKSQQCCCFLWTCCYPNYELD